MKSLRTKITRLEEQMRIKTIPPDDRFIVIQGHRWEREEKTKKRKAELIEKYGPECLDQVLFVDFQCFCDECSRCDEDSG